MKRNKLYTIAISMACLLTLTLGLGACRSLIFEGEGDCSYHNSVRFVYDHNIKFADAFSHEVRAVSLYVFDSNGLYVDTYQASGTALADPNYTLCLDDLDPGTYTILSWCTWNKESDLVTTSFVINDGNLIPGESTITEVTARLNTTTVTTTTDTCVVATDINPLFHGTTIVTICDEPGHHITPLHLTKNTNSVRIVLQQLSGEPVDASKFQFYITSANGAMACDNTLLPCPIHRYEAWHLSQGSADVILNGENVTTTTAVAELSTARIVATERPHLVIVNDKGETAVSIPLAEYLLMVKGYYGRQMSDQEYLDRQDEYSLTFFLDNQYQWDKMHIIINSWTLVISNDEIGDGWR